MLTVTSRGIVSHFDVGSCRLELIFFVKNQWWSHLEKDLRREGEVNHGKKLNHGQAC